MCGGIASFGIHQQDVDSASQSFATWLWGLGSNVSTSPYGRAQPPRFTGVLPLQEKLSLSREGEYGRTRRRPCLRAVENVVHTACPV